MMVAFYFVFHAVDRGRDEHAPGRTRTPHQIKGTTLESCVTDIFDVFWLNLCRESK